MRTGLEATAEFVEVVADDLTGKKVIKIVTREEARQNRELTWTSQATVNVDGYELVTLRGNGNKIYPRQWEIGITETLRAGESPEEAICYGLEEELLIPRGKQGKITHLFDLHYRNPRDATDWKNVSVHRYFHNGPIRYDSNEIATALLLPHKAIGWVIATGTFQFTPMNTRVYEVLVEKGVFR